MPPNLTITALAKGLGVDRKTVRGYVADGCPRTSVEAAAAWKAKNVRPRVTPERQKPGRKPAAASPYQDARTRSAVAEAEKSASCRCSSCRASWSTGRGRAELARRLAGMRDSALLQIPNAAAIGARG
jgi:hypothetical protein